MFGTTGGTAAVGNLDLKGFEGTGESQRVKEGTWTAPSSTAVTAEPTDHTDHAAAAEHSRCRASCCYLVVPACGRGGDLGPTNHQGSKG